jgi:D-hexose-6-phosphate mutarotase
MTQAVPAGALTGAGSTPPSEPPAGPPLVAPEEATGERSAGRAAQPVVVQLGPGRGDLDRVLVSTPTASAEVYLQGAHLTAWAPAGEPAVVWTSDHSLFAPGAPIRGGVPVCFPWFGPDPTGTGPLHGLVRTRDWTFAGWDRVGDDVALTFTLGSGALPDARGPFALRYTVTVGTRLTLALEVTNTGTEPLTFEEALHTYLAVGDVRTATMRGLDDLERLDRLTGRHARTPTGAELRVVAETDHLYSQPGAVTVADWDGGRTVGVRTQGSANAVVWNPWADRARTLPDLGDDEWSQMVCVETCNVAEAAVVLAPGAAHTMVATITVGPLA